MTPRPSSLMASALWLACGARAALAYRRALAQPRRAQEALLLSLLRRNAGSRYGQRFSFGTIRSVREYQQRVPSVSHDEILEEIDAIARGEQRVLTEEPVLAMERTTGSTAPSKLVPFTRSLLREFQAALAPWMADLYSHHPQLMGGGAYWSVSPLRAEAETTTGGLPVGFEEDVDYFEGLGRPFLRRLIATPRGLARIADLDDCRYATLRYLLAAEDLRFISVWHPSFLTLLLDAMQAHADKLVQDVERGTLTTSRALPDALVRAQRPRPRRAKQLRAILRRRGSLAPDEVWPALRVISCWASAAAAPYARELATLFPQAELQPKGLLATEGVVSIPLVGQAAAALAVTSHVFEFIADGADARPLLADELELGGSYSVLLTNGGGLYRYALGDRVRVVGRVLGTPLIEFVGKEALVSDLRGEKLHQQRIGSILDAVFQEGRLAPAFAMLAPETGRPPCYVLYVESPGLSDEASAALGARVEEALLEGHHYRYCRRLGQLGPARTFRIRSGAARAYLERCAALGQRLGSVKPTPLHRADGWSVCFDGVFVEPRVAAQAR